MYAAYILNRVPSASADKSPFEIWYGRKPDVAHIRVFGCRSFVHIPDTLRRKMDAKAQECMLVGYCETRKAYRMWNPATRKLAISRDVIFEESKTYSGNPNCLPTGTMDSTVQCSETPWFLEATFQMKANHQEGLKVSPDKTNANTSSADHPEPIDEHTDGLETEAAQEEEQPPIQEENEMATLDDTTLNEEARNNQDNEPFNGWETSRRKSSRTPVYTEKYRLFMGLTSTDSRKQTLNSLSDIA